MSSSKGILHMPISPSELTDSSPGKLVEIEHDVFAFIPDDLPRELSLPSHIVKRLAKAENGIGQLLGICGREFNPFLIASPMLHREAILSSKLEGTITTPRQLVLFELADEEADTEHIDTQEVVNYTCAMKHGLALMESLPVCLRLIREEHKVLMSGVRGSKEKPGEFRTSQNYIRSKVGRGIKNARYIPPPVKEMNVALDNFERYVNTEEDQCENPILIRLALIHYQFEAIHPFRDGNGRIGRLILPLILCNKGKLNSPILYMSAFFERNRDEYVDLLLNVSRTGDWISWIDFFLEAVLVSAEESITIAEALLELRQQYHRLVQKGRSTALLVLLIDSLFQLPAITINKAANLLNVSHQAAANNIRKLEDLGILTEISGRSRNMVFIAEKILSFMYEHYEKNM
ncbi:Fic family protein [Candidatus Fermentibacteria bacterium]|nr:Fic family protein [Candidatus Fermentibacteria bacterium]